MKRLRLLFCVVFGHRSVVLFHKEFKRSGEPMTAVLLRCERCGKRDRVESPSTCV